jgi:hypothetical protein
VERRRSPARVVVLRGDAEVAGWPLAGVRVDLGLVDALARLQLAVRRADCSLVLVDVDRDLLGLLALTGLRDVLAPRLRIEVVREAEGGEEGGVEEVVVTDDPVA